jgi:hypothetical protein
MKAIGMMAIPGGKDHPLDLGEHALGREGWSARLKCFVTESWPTGKLQLSSSEN